MAPRYWARTPTMILLESGLIGLIALRRKFRK